MRQDSLSFQKLRSDGPGRSPAERERTLVSLCPDCHQDTGASEFCRSCFRSLEPAAPGRFSSLLDQGLARPCPPSPPAGPDLLAVTFEPRPGGGRRRFFFKFRQLAALALVFALSMVGLRLYQRQKYREGVQHRLNGIALTRQGDLEGAHRQLAAAPEEAETYQARAELAVAEGNWPEAAELFRKISVDDAEVNAHVDAAAQERARALVKEARLSLDTARALSLSDQAETLLDQHNARPEQRAEVHFLRATLFEKLALRSEALGELRTALGLDPGHSQARQLLARWAPPPVAEAPLARRPVSARRETPATEIPHLQTQPDYPTYQPPDEDLDDRLVLPDSRRKPTGPNNRKRRRL